MTLQVSLSADGGLQLELPGPHGTVRSIPLRDTGSCSAVETIKRVLLAQASQAVAIGEDGSPTRAQVRHWERHQIWTDPRCSFCKAEDVARASPREAKPHQSSHEFDRRYQQRGDVLVRRCEPVVPAKATRKSLEDMGF